MKESNFAILERALAFWLNLMLVHIIEILCSISEGFPSSCLSFSWTVSDGAWIQCR